MTLKGKHIAILVENLYQELEVWYPILRFREAGAKVTTVGSGEKTYTSKLGYPVAADTSADKVKADDFDAIIIPGGYAPDHMRRHETMIELVREMERKGKVIGSICHGGWMLVSADVLRNKRATAFFAIKDDIINAGGLYEDSEVVRDGTLITSRIPDDLPAFCRTLIEALSGKGQSSSVDAA